MFVRTKDGFEKRDVVLGQKEDQTLEIVSGLTPGETIAVTNTNFTQVGTYSVLVVGGQVTNVGTLVMRKLVAIEV